MPFVATYGKSHFRVCRADRRYPPVPVPFKTAIRPLPVFFRRIFLKMPCRTRWWNFSCPFVVNAYGLLCSDGFYLRFSLVPDKFAKGILSWCKRLSFKKRITMSYRLFPAGREIPVSHGRLPFINSRSFGWPASDIYFTAKLSPSCNRQGHACR